ncbi:hypothetical protein BDZ97DRAFT_2059843 [Flammula alnicola]|nr:hypothetical protein BDZ97DRAFT_2059843 [Flammula alnicola]
MQLPNFKFSANASYVDSISIARCSDSGIRRRWQDSPGDNKHSGNRVNQIGTALPRRVPKSPQVWEWGWNEHGNLGMSHTEDAPTSVKLWPPPGDDEKVLNVCGIWAGSGTSWICATVTPDLQ